MRPHDNAGYIVTPLSKTIPIQLSSADYNVSMVKMVKHTATQERQGIAVVQQIVASDLEWIFREQPTDDYGIDAQIEVVKDNTATGQLLAAQIKSGSSYFTKESDEGWWYALKKDDLAYWLEHSLPVVVVIYDPVTKSAYWQAVNEQTVVTGKRGGKRLLIPKTRELSQCSKDELESTAEGKPYDLRIRKLRLSLPWMKLIQSGRRLLLEADEQVNKSSSRGFVQLVSVNETNGNSVKMDGWYFNVGQSAFEDALPSLFPWADIILHKETYDNADNDAWHSECVHYDRWGDLFVSESFEDWILEREDGSRLRPYSNSADEIDHWRLELVLNDLAKSFIIVDQYAKGEGIVLAPGLR